MSEITGRIVILGAGAWGTALAVNLSRRADLRVTLWAHTPEHAAALVRERENRRYLPGVSFSPAVHVEGDLQSATAGAALILLATPSQHLRTAADALAGLALPPATMLVSAAKGIEDGTLLRMTQVLAEVLPGHPTGVLSGPSFAQEVAAGTPAALTVAFPAMADAERAQTLLSTESMRLYRNTDVAGVELGGALKNVIAIATGAVAGLELGYNSAAALITRGIAEMTRLALACGGRRETLAGLAGVGDMILTCTGALSRNRFVGVELGRGRSLAEITASLNGKVAEGIRTTGAALALATRHDVDMPIAVEVQALLEGRRSAAEAVRALMARPGRDE